MKYACHLILIIIMQILPSVVQASEFHLVPSVALREDYNSNVLLSSDDVRNDFVTALSAGIAMIYRTETLDSDLSARMDRLEYAKNSGFSATNQSYNGKLRYYATPLFSISAAAGYLKNANPTLDTLAAGVSLKAEPWERIISSLVADYRLNEITTTAISYNYDRQYYERSSSLNDTSHEFNIGLEHDFGRYYPTLKGRINAGYLYYDSPDSSVKSFTGTAGFSKNLNELWNISVDSGIRYTKSALYTKQFQIWVPDDDDDGGGGGGGGGGGDGGGDGGEPPPPFRYVRVSLENNDWGWVVMASLKYRGERLNGSLGYYSDITPAYGFNGAAKRNAFTLSARYQLTYELSASFMTGYSTFRSDPLEYSTDGVDENTFRINPMIRYEFSRNAYVEASYSFLMVDNRESESEADRHLCSLRLHLQHPFFE